MIELEVILKSMWYLHYTYVVFLHKRDEYPTPLTVPLYIWSMVVSKNIISCYYVRKYSHDHK